MINSGCGSARLERGAFGAKVASSRGREEVMQYRVYILESDKTNKFYVGHTDDLERRIGEHNGGESLSTKHGIPWKSIYQENFKTRSEAMKRETQIKKRGIERFLRDSEVAGNR